MLLPCPFCGCEAESDARQYHPTFDGKGGNRATVYCTGCSADMGFCYGDWDHDPEDLPEYVVSLWNTRTTPPIDQQSVTPEMVLALRERIDMETGNSLPNNVVADMLAKVLARSAATPPIDQQPCPQCYWQPGFHDEGCPRAIDQQEVERVAKALEEAWLARGYANGEQWRYLARAALSATKDSGTTGSLTLDSSSVQRLMDYGLLHYTDAGWTVSKDISAPSLQEGRQ